MISLKGVKIYGDDFEFLKRLCEVDAEKDEWVKPYVPYYFTLRDNLYRNGLVKIEYMSGKCWGTEELKKEMDRIETQDRLDQCDPSEVMIVSR